ncbi:hypothetical protein HNR65_003447 [Desulfosalsimonas propionicica]|uniref:DNA primase/polymerase bifunctional N-terminal domain-containing protein n=1 Tax=Desulfosalsimonas propionicica TaxID=332175 RepID=A0A7W0CC95_9BACT|nr:DUF3987 domain-containing protein [Desulfosalsimonas propionicica]MBA2883090.1 hypothetical protein [Desulfosalsimonas propionicica]
MLEKEEARRGAATGQGQEKSYNHNRQARFTSQDIIKAIERYHSQKISTFPLSKDKTPLVEGWPDRDFLLEEHDRQGVAGIGTCPGRWPVPVMVFDIDGPQGRESWQRCLEQYGPLPPTFSVTTGRDGGGEHFYYRTPPGLFVKSNASKFAPKIDLRGTRGQAVLPPTTHRSGKRYAWRFDGQTCEWIDPEKIPMLPAPWLQALIDTGSAYYPGQQQDRSSERREFAGHSTAYALKALEGEIAKVQQAEKDTRNNSLNDAAFRLGTLVAGGELSRNLVEQSLLNAALDAGLPEREAKKTIESGLKSGERKPRQAPRKDSGGERSQSSTAEPDADPEPLPDELLPVAPFDFALLPNSLRPWAEDICERMQCPPDFIAAGIMAALAGLIGRKVAVRPQARTDWTVVCNLWALVVGRPGVLKSPALEQALAPVKRLAAMAAERHEQAEAEYQAEAMAAKLKKEAAEKQARKALEKNPDADLSALFAVGEPAVPQLKRYIANDTSPASLGELLRQNPNGLLVFRDEIVSLLKSLDREGQEEGRGFYLTAWNGDSPYTFDRIGRGLNLHIPAVCLSVLGGTQPGRLSEYIRQAVKGGAADDGLIQRFGLLVWPDTGGKWQDVDRWPDTDAKNQAFKVFDRLDRLNPLKIGAEQDTDQDGAPDGPPYLRFEPAALELFQEWRATLENRLRGELHPALESHFAKYRKLIPSIALINHLADNGTGPVSEQATLQALAWGEYLETHAQRAYGSVSQPEITVATAILGRIKKGDLKTPFTKWEVWRPGWAKLTDKDQVKEALTLLEAYGWIFRERIEATGGRPKTVYHVNERAKL